MRRYEPERYWQERLSKDFSLGGVGHSGLGLEYNRWLYRARLRALTKVLRKNEIDVKGKRVLELGVGNGFYVEFWKRMGATSITGVDITEKSISSLRTKYPQWEFIQSDISSRGLRIQGTFDVITAFDVLFHIVDEHSFEQALGNIARLSHRGTRVILMDTFMKEGSFRGFHECHRTMDRYTEALVRVGMEPVAIVPIFCFMSNPVDKSRLKSGLMRRVVPLAWAFVATLALLRKLGPLGECAGYLAGLSLYTIDGIALRYIKDGPSSKLMLARSGHVKGTE